MPSMPFGFQRGYWLYPNRFANCLLLCASPAVVLILDSCFKVEVGRLWVNYTTKRANRKLKLKNLFGVERFAREMWMVRQAISDIFSRFRFR